MAQTLTQLTLAWLISTIEATRAGLAGSLAQTPVADWGAAPVREVRNHEQDLHTAMQVLGDMLNARGAFAASGIPAAPHLEQVPAYVCGVDLSAEYVAALKQARADSIQHEWRACIERTPAPALKAPAAPANDLALIVAALEHSQPQMAHYAEPRERHAQALAAARRLAAAPNAPAAPMHLGTPHCAGHSVPLDGSWSTIDADANKGA